MYWVFCQLFECDKWSLCTQNSWGDKPHGTDRPSIFQNFMVPHLCPIGVKRGAHKLACMRVPKITPPEESIIWQCSYRKFLFFSIVLSCKRSQMEGLFWTWNGWLVFSFWSGLKTRCASCIMEHAQYMVYICALIVVRGACEEFGLCHPSFPTGASKWAQWPCTPYASKQNAFHDLYNGHGGFFKPWLGQ